MAEEFVTQETPELLSDTVGKQEALISVNRPSKIAWSAGKSVLSVLKRTEAYWSVLKTKPEVEGGVCQSSVALCVSVCVPSLVFSPCGKRAAKVKIAVCLSVVSVVTCHSDKACSARMCDVDCMSSLLLGH